MVVAGTGLEPATSGLWARRATNCSTPRYLVVHCIASMRINIIADNLRMSRGFLHFLKKNKKVHKKQRTGSLSVLLNYPSSLFNKTISCVVKLLKDTTPGAITITPTTNSGYIYSTTLIFYCQEDLKNFFNSVILTKNRTKICNFSQKTT